MKTQIKQMGNSKVIILNKDFLKFHNLQVGDWVDLEDIFKVKRINGDKK